MDQILLIEDDSTIAAGLAYSLEQEGWKVTSIGTLAQGKEALETGRYQLLLVDVGLPEICRICPKTAYNLEQQGEIPYTIEQNHLIRSHKIKLTDILAYLYRRECRQEADSPYICAMRTFYDKHLSPYSDLLSVKDIQQITGFSSSAIVRWISIGILKAFQPGKQYTVPKDFMLDFLISPYYRRIRRKTPVQKELMDTFERLWQEKGGE